MSTEESLISSNKIAIVTGGSRGLGRNTILSLAKRGVSLHPHLQIQSCRRRQGRSRREGDRG